MIFIPPPRPHSSAHTAGRRQISKPSFSASATRCFAMLTPLTSPLRPTSPKATSFGLRTLLWKLDRMAITIPKSMAGSSTFKPPVMFT